MSFRLTSRRGLAALAAACLVSVSLPAGTAFAQKVKSKGETTAEAPSEIVTNLSVSVPTIDAVDSSVDAATLTAIFQGELVANADALASLDATSITVPQIILTIDATVDGTSQQSVVTFSDLVLEDVVDGRAASVSLASTEVTSEEANATFGTMAAANLDIGGLLGIYGLVDAGDRTTLETIYSDFTSEGGELTSEEVNCSIGAMSAAEFKARPLQTSLGDMIVLAQALEDEPDNPDPAVLGQMLRMYADIFTAFETSEMAVDGFSCEGIDDEGRAVDISVAGMTMGGMQPGIYPAISMTGFGMSVEGDGSISLDDLSIKQMDLTNTIATLQSAPDTVDEAWLEANARGLIPAFEGFSFDGLSIDLPDPETEGARIVADIAGFDLTLGNYRNGIPASVDTSATNIQFALPAESDDEQVQQLIALGITDIDAGFRVAAAWDEATSTIAVEEISMTGADLASVFLAGTIANATQALFSVNEDEALAAAMGVAVKSLDLTIDDYGLSDIILAVAAADQGADPAALRPMFAGLAEGTVIGMMAGAADAAKLGAAVNSFVSGTAKSLNIVIDAKSDPGLSLFDFMAAEQDPASLIGKVNISATAK